MMETRTLIDLLIMNVVPKTSSVIQRKQTEDYVEQERTCFPRVGDFNYSLDQHGTESKVNIKLSSIYSNDIISFEISYIPILIILI